MTEILRDDEIVMRKSFLESDCVLISSELFDNFPVKGSAREAFPVHASILYHERIRDVDCSVKESDVSIGKTGVFLAECGEFLLDESNDGGESLMFVGPEGMIDLLVGIVASIEVHEAFKSGIFFILELCLNLFLLSQVCNFLEEEGEHIGGGHLVAPDRTVYHFDVGFVFFLVGCGEGQILFVPQPLSLASHRHHHSLHLILEVVDVGVPGDGFDEVDLGGEGVDGVTSRVGDSPH